MKKILYFFSIFLLPFTSTAQNDVELFVNDMLLIADNFAEPAAEGASYLSGAGWFSSAKDLELWELEVSVLGNVLFVPEKKKSTDITNSDYRTFDIQGGQSANIPTAFGGSTDVVFEGEILGNQFEFDAIEGVNKSVLAHPFFQGSVGLPYGTDLTVRFLPSVNIDDVAFSTYGVGLKHNFNQYFFNSQPNDFQFAAMVAYSKYDVDYEFVPLLVEYEILNEQRVALEMDQIEVDANLFLFQVLTSKTFFDSGWEIFGALGVSSSSIGYVAGGGGDFLGQMNSALETLDENNFEFKGDVGLSYQISNFKLSSMISAGKFFNANLGLHVRI
ncbi:DUF6588 family protein [Salinimicrobium sp. TH3]|uniref:DUF6588 family protein n=1 Tax=Salinimicrobium sp. TH3 TaxID=2997342 RepID=UPI002273F503|nr:DUF6588 family protein [Salinimicrobium sp. TH3]MCY2688386.1 hypothetical protein [Salinimicrobium sp. TH3]